MKKWIIGILILLVLAFVVFPLGLSFTKVIRSRQHLTAAIQLKEQGDDRTAYFRIQSAYNLNPDYSPILEKLGPYAAAVDHPNALEWWILAARKGVLDLNETLEMVEYGLEQGQINQVRPFLTQFVTLYPESEAVQALRVRILQHQREDFEAFSLAKKLVEEGTTDTNVISAYIVYAFNLPQAGDEERQAAFENLKRFSSHSDEIGIMATRTLLRAWNTLDPAEKETMERRVQEHPDASLNDRLILLSLQKQDGKDGDAVLAEALTEFQAQDSSDDHFSTFINWLIVEGFHDQALALLEDQGLEDDPALFFARQRAWIESGKPETAYQASLEENPLTPSRNLVLRAQALMGMGKPAEAREALKISVEVAGLEEVNWLQSAFATMGEQDLRIQLFENLAQSVSDPLPANIRLMNLYYESGKEIELSRILRKIPLDRLAGYPSDKINYLYYSLIFGQEVPENRREIERSAAEFPTIADFRILLGFSYALSGENAFAWEIVKSLQAIDLANRPKLQIMMAGLLRQNENPEKAETILGELEMNTLLPQERAFLQVLN